LIYNSWLTFEQNAEHTSKSSGDKKTTTTPEVSTPRTAKISKYFSDRFGISLENGGKGISSEETKNDELTESQSDSYDEKVIPEKLRLPPLDASAKETKSARKSETLQEYRLPRLVDRIHKSSAKSHTRRGGKETQQAKKKSKTRSEMKDLEKLLDAAVESSKTMIKAHPNEAISVKVRATTTTHHRYHRPSATREKTSAATVGGGDQQNQKHKPQATEGKDDRVGLLDSSGVAPIVTNERKTPGMSSQMTGDGGPDWGSVADPDQILASLPEQSHDANVQNWIWRSKKTYPNSTKPTIDTLRSPSSSGQKSPREKGTGHASKQSS